MRNYSMILLSLLSLIGCSSSQETTETTTTITEREEFISFTPETWTGETVFVPDYGTTIPPVEDQGQLYVAEVVKPQGKVRVQMNERTHAATVEVTPSPIAIRDKDTVATSTVQKQVTIEPTLWEQVAPWLAAIFLGLILFGVIYKVAVKPL